MKVEAVGGQALDEQASRCEQDPTQNDTMPQIRRLGQRGFSGMSKLHLADGLQFAVQLAVQLGEVGLRRVGLVTLGRSSLGGRVGAACPCGGPTELTSHRRESLALPWPGSAGRYGSHRRWGGGRWGGGRW
ncbi:MAG: hypothetical protein JKY65_03590, partial [Planctomycetes bacterium]|nr:hypothetical protein [Planctomycetota bacterium]